MDILNFGGIGNGLRLLIEGVRFVCWELWFLEILEDNVFGVDFFVLKIDLLVLLLIFFICGEGRGFVILFWLMRFFVEVMFWLILVSRLWDCKCWLIVVRFKL